MTEQQHLTTALNQQKALSSEIQELNNAMVFKREQFLKLQGVIEYLVELGVTPAEQTQETNRDIEK